MGAETKVLRLSFWSVYKNKSYFKRLITKINITKTEGEMWT